MRYTREGSKDWVEFKPGFGKLPMAKAVAAWQSPDGVAPWIAKCQFTSVETGEGVTITNGASIMEGLNFHQWDFLTEKLREWARDDVVDPEV